MARWHSLPSDEDLAYTMASATSKCIGKNVYEPNWKLESRERSKNDTQCIQCVRPCLCRLAASCPRITLWA